MSSASALAQADAVAHIELQHPRAAAHVPDALGDLLGFAAARPAVHHHVVAVIGEAQRNGAADAAAGAGDQDGVGHDEPRSSGAGGTLRQKG